MACAPYGKEYTFVNTTALTLTTILGTGERKWSSNILIRAGAANVDDLYFGKSNLTTVANRLGYLQPGESMGLDLHAFFSSDELFLAGSPGDKVHVFGFF